MIDIVHWNAFTINNKNKLVQLESFLSREKTAIMCLNETKLESKLAINNYDTIQKNRNCNGGGVAILIRNDLSFLINTTFDQFELELVAIDLKLENENFTIISMYLPPQAPFPPIEFFEQIEK